MDKDFLGRAPMTKDTASQTAPFGWAYRVNGTHDLFHWGAEPPPDDAYDAGTLVAVYAGAAPPAAPEQAQGEREAFEAWAVSRDMSFDRRVM